MQKYFLLVVLFIFLIKNVFASLEIGISEGKSTECIATIKGHSSIVIGKSNVNISFDSKEIPMIYNNCSFTVIDKKKRSVSISGAHIYASSGCVKKDTCTIYFSPSITGMAGSENIKDPIVLAGKHVVIKAKNRKKALVALDAGHGGEDSGAIGRHGTKEKDINLKYAKLIEKELKKVGFDVFLTRKDDIYMSLHDRIDKAMEVKADFFISIHADSAKNFKARGSTVYILSSHAINSATKNVEARTSISGNFLKSDTDEDLIFNILNIQHRSNVIQASDFAKNLLEKMKKNDIRLTSFPLRSADFAVLKAPTFPAVLLELAYLSNSEDEKMLQRSAYGRKVAVSIAGTLKESYAE